MSLSRRDLLKQARIGSAAVVSGQALPAVAQETLNPVAGRAPSGEVLSFFTPDEARFIGAAVARLIPADDLGPGAKEAGVVIYIDRQLASAYGAGARMYLKGPWEPNAPAQQGYQLRYSPAALYRIAIAEINAELGADFAALPAEAQDGLLRQLESGAIALTRVPAAVFFETLLAHTIEGFFADPVYGGNRDMAGWKLVGFPGAYAAFANLVDSYGYDYRRPPISIADGKGAMKM